jgi:hypothetical protein
LFRKVAVLSQGTIQEDTRKIAMYLQKSIGTGQQMAVVLSVIVAQHVTDQLAWFAVSVGVRWTKLVEIEKRKPCLQPDAAVNFGPNRDAPSLGVSVSQNAALARLRDIGNSAGRKEFSGGIK